MALLLSSEDGHFFLRRDVSETEIHGESIHLSFRQRIGASKLDRILSGDDEEEFRQSAPFPFDADLRFTHSLEEGGLGPGRGAVDFIGEKNVGEDGPLVKLKLLLLLIVNRNPQDIRREQVGSELDALELGIDGTSENFGEGCFAGAGIVLEQDVTITREGSQELSQGLALPFYDELDVGEQPLVNFDGGELVHRYYGTDGLSIKHFKRPKGAARFDA